MILQVDQYLHTPTVGWLIDLLTLSSSQGNLSTDQHDFLVTNMNTSTPCNLIINESCVFSQPKKNDTPALWFLDWDFFWGRERFVESWATVFIRENSSTWICLVVGCLERVAPEEWCWGNYLPFGPNPTFQVHSTAVSQLVNLAWQIAQNHHFQFDITSTHSWSIFQLVMLAYRSELVLRKKKGHVWIYLHAKKINYHWIMEKQNAQINFI